MPSLVVTHERNLSELPRLLEEAPHRSRIVAIFGSEQETASYLAQRSKADSSGNDRIGHQCSL